MSNTLSVRLSNRKTPTGEYYEGTVSITGLKPTKLVRRADGSTQFPTRSAVCGSARNLAKALGFADVGIVDANATAATPKTAKKAAKKSSVVPSKVNTKTGNTCTKSSAPAATTTNSAVRSNSTNRSS